MDDTSSRYRVVPFGDPRIKGYLHLPAAFRSLSRPSSPPRAKASAMRPSLLSLSRSHFRLLAEWDDIYFQLCTENYFLLVTSCHRPIPVERITGLNRLRAGLQPPSSSCISNKQTLQYKGKNRCRHRSRKEVFQPHLPVRLPCYDLAPITGFTLGRSSRLRTSGTPGFHGLTGGVYKARERIHRAVADARLLANPASWSRVADSSPN